MVYESTSELKMLSEASVDWRGFEDLCEVPGISVFQQRGMGAFIRLLYRFGRSCTLILALALHLVVGPDCHSM